MADSFAFAELCERELELCAVRQGETLVIVSQGDERMEYVDPFLAAGRRLGATVLHLRLPSLPFPASGWTSRESGREVGQNPLRDSPAALELLKRADIVIETLFLLFSDELRELQRAGTRILTCIEPIDVLARLFPTVELRARAEAGAELLAAASVLRFTNPAGTDVTYQLGTYPVQTQYGFVDRPGRWDHWPSGSMVMTGGDDDGVSGRVVIAPGDILLPFKIYAREPITLTIEGGRIVAIEGGTDAELVRGYMADFADPDAYGLSHIGWGMDERAKWTALATDTRGHGMELRAFAGNVLFSTGPNHMFGGPNATACHLDIPMRGCSLWLDDRLVINGGTIVVDALRAADGPHPTRLGDAGARAG